jgi:hypothetical protein
VVSAVIILYLFSGIHIEDVGSQIWNILLKEKEGSDDYFTPKPSADPI